jgi:hypothetical protein
MLTSEFQKAFEYTKGLIRTDLASIILFLACLIPYVNFFMLMRYVDKIVSEPSANTSPPKLVNPNWTELIVSLLKIIVVGLVWGIIAAILIVPAGLILGISALLGSLSIVGLLTRFSLAILGVTIYAFIVIVAVSLLAIMSEVNMLKNGKNLNAAFAISDLMNKISKLGWLRYILFALCFSIAFGIITIISSGLGILLNLDVFTVSLVGIFGLFVTTFFAKTISMLYDQNTTANPKPQ